MTGYDTLNPSMSFLICVAMMKKYPDYKWVDGNQAIDTAHLEASSSEASFIITPKDLERLCQQSLFAYRGGKILFGIRGAALLVAPGIWHDALTLKELTPNHYEPCCVIGIWNRLTHQLCAFQASTVPNAQWMFAQQQSSNRVANLLGQGLYSYYIGPHEPDGSTAQEGAWCMNRFIDVGVWRLRGKGLGYSLADEFDACYPDDNLHCAHTGTNECTRIQFSSAGCQTIPGNHFPPECPTGHYQMFRMLSGQTYQPDPSQLGLMYDYILINARHLRLIHDHGFNGLRLMQGSSGILVRQVQEQLLALGFLSDHGINKGYYNGKTALAVYQFQQQHGILADALIKPHDLQVLKQHMQALAK